MPYRRGKILIDKKFQLKFSFFVCSWLFLLSMVYPLIIYGIFEYFLKYVPNTTPQVIEKFRNIQNQVIFLLALLQLLFLSITFFISIFLSHRIAGPLYKLRKALADVARGNLDQKIVFRKNDHFMELQDQFNDMVQHLSVRKWKP